LEERSRGKVWATGCGEGEEERRRERRREPTVRFRGSAMDGKTVRPVPADEGTSATHRPPHPLHSGAEGNET
jgi:hypothetical protein